MDPVYEGGPWTQSKEGVYGPGVHVLPSPGWEDSQEKDYSFLGDDTFPNLYDVLNERKFKSEYLERQIYERLRVNLPS